MERKVKTESLGSDVTALLSNFVAQNLAETCLQQVSCGMKVGSRFATVGKPALKALTAGVVAEFLVFCKTIRK